MLLLEKLAASPTDSLTYYAFAEDNYPAGPQRTETDLRYIDIRPFKREYKMGDPASRHRGGTASSRRWRELIARQRFNLNRAIRLAKHKPTDKTFAEDPLKIAGFEETLAGLTREFTEGVEGIVGQRIEPLHAGRGIDARRRRGARPRPERRGPGHMGDALRHLIEARDSLQHPDRPTMPRGPGDAQLRPHAGPEDPQAQEGRGGGRGDRRANSRSSPRKKTSSTRRSPALEIEQDRRREEGRWPGGGGRTSRGREEGRAGREEGGGAKKGQGPEGTEGHREGRSRSEDRPGRERRAGG